MENNTMSTKKAVVVLGSLLFLIGLSLVIPAQYVGLKPVKRPRINTTINDDLVALKQDTDNNGSADWRDLLNSQMSTTTKEAAKNTVVDEVTKRRLADPNNITASFSKNVYTAAAYAKQQGNNLTQADQEALATTIAEQEAAKIIIKTYEITDIHLSKDETPASKKAYVNALGTIYTKNKVATMTIDDAAKLQAYTTSKDTSILTSFVVKKNILDTIIAQLIAMSVPYSAATYHILLLNSLSSYASMLDSISKAEDDPLRTAIAIKTYTTTMRSLYSSLTSLGDYITLENITLTPSEAGYVLISK